MAYNAGDTFLPSWGSGMVPRESTDADEENSIAYDDYPPKPHKLATHSCIYEEHLQDVDDTQVMQPCIESQMKPYGTMSDAADSELGDSSLSTPGSNDRVFEKKSRRTGRLGVAEKSLFLLWWPAFLGSCIVFAFGLKYWHHPDFAWTVFIFSVLFGVIMIAIGSRDGIPSTASPTFMIVNGCFIVALALTSLGLGMFCFDSYTKQFEIYRGSRHYENIISSANPGSDRDAGIIDFAAGSHVDPDRSIGIRNGVTYCVAPIVAPESSNYVGFWAVGIDCCSGRGRFHCGDFSSLEARSGLVVLDEDSFEANQIPEYTKAAEEASSQFALTMPAKPIFVRWTGNPTAAMEQYYHDGMTFVSRAAAGLFGFMLVIVMLLCSGGEGFGHAYYSLEIDGAASIARPRSRMKAKRNTFGADPW